jgi:2-polyprenyl-6-hydroxyphenyl methylase / 3-demethylubiquinone-9 3-methyltransferase
MNALRRLTRHLPARLTAARLAVPKPAKVAKNKARSPLPGAHLLALLTDPPGQSPVYTAYNRLRQHYIVAQTMAYFKARDDDPAPLFEKTLLDIGCGDATIAEFLALAGAEITAIDPNPAALAKARASAAAFGAPVEFINTTAEKLVTSGERYDVILALDLLEVTPNPAKMLWCIKQLLAPGGVVVLSVIHRSPWAWVLHVLFSTYVYGRVARENRSYSRFFSPLALARLLKGAGLRLGQVQWLRFSSTRRRWVYAPSGSKRATRYVVTVSAPEIP